ncbi:TonB-dependent siderophore receptor [Sphingosinicella sp. CPCC 101087]|uniref:TonB-dependent receptor plug domain-containing protein n=1 Tax=Sphingosinicella sp. CPCC 101087 TaxID=2497754 RepID=UPI00101D744C|nr:TonB-dependent receptor [Sphingosinicella sp. CPCC 101087]
MKSQKPVASVFALLLLSASWPVLAQSEAVPPAEAEDPALVEDPAFDPDAELDEEVYDQEIVVAGTRRPPRGSVIGDIEPEVTLNARDIRAYGASNLAELLEELSPLTGSIQGRGGGQPVILLGGRRISSFREIRDLPPEAVVRVDILPEEVALKYGYRADQKVVNFVLRRRFEAVTAEVETVQATAGGRQEYEADVNYLRIAEGSRLSIDAEYERSNPLFETERDLADADPDRTLLSASDSAELGATYNRTILGNVSATLSAELEGEDTLAALGRAEDGSQRLLRNRRSRTGDIGYALNGDLAGWNWSLDGGYERIWSTTLTDRDLPGGVGRDRAESAASTIRSEGTASGELFELPAGAVSATIGAGFNLRDIESESSRSGIVTSTRLSRDQGNVQANLDLPLLDDSPVGTLSANANGRVERLSDFGTLTTLGYGINWEPVDEVRLIASMTHEEGAPSIQQLGDPVLATPNVRVLDLVTGRTVDVTRIEGGNPDLLADNRRELKLGLTVRPLDGLTVLANFTDERTENPTASFPTATPEIEAAFPDRFERDAEGNLLRIDSRPVNFARSRQRQIRWGFNWSETLEAPPPIGPDGQPLTPEQIEERREARRSAREGGQGPGAGERGGRGGGRFGGGGGRGFGGGRQGRVQLSLFHTVRLVDTILIRPGVPELDLLDGSAVGGRGGQPRHEVQLRAGYSRNGLGARLNVDWQSATRLRADPNGAPSPQDLTFGDLATVNLRLFADLGAQRALVRSVPFFRSSRVTLAVDNLFDQRLDVRDAAGVVPIGYQPDLLDPIGRSIRISFRKLFF